MIMTNEQLIVFVENQIRLLEKAFEESDGMMVNVARHITEDDEQDGVVNRTDAHGTALALDPIKNEIDAMKGIVRTLRGLKMNENLNTSKKDRIDPVFVNGNGFKVTKRYIKYDYRTEKLVQCDEVDGIFEECKIVMEGK